MLSSLVKSMLQVAVAAALVALGCGLLPSNAAADSAVVAPEQPVTHSGRWLLDARGRVLVIHGMNVPSKSLPAYPAGLGFGASDAGVLASLGFNAVRLTVERYAAEPSPGQFDPTYPTHVGDTVDALAGQGILSLIDFHQDEYGPVFYDNGYPSWMTVTDGLPNNYYVGFPGQYLANPALERAFDHLWANDAGPDGRPLQTDDAAILSHQVADLQGHPGILGYEILNEPWPGSNYPTCLGLGVGCPLFDRGPVSAYYARMVAAMRPADPTRLIFYEPLVTFNYGIRSWVRPPRDSRLGFAFHDYSLCSAADDSRVPVSVGKLCAPEDAIAQGNAIKYANQNGTALLETEFGATADAKKLDQQLAQYDQRMIPWMFWSYTGYIDPYAPDGSLQKPTDANLNWNMVRILARPYPQLVAGTPLGWHFDPSAKTFSLRYSTVRAAGRRRFTAGSETDVAVPAVQYPHGYRVTVKGARVTSSANAGILRLAQTAGARTVTVSVSPAVGP